MAPDNGPEGPSLGRVTDSYTAAVAARVLGCSERLVRKMAAQERLEIVGRDPLLVSQESVHQMRSTRKTRPQRTDPSGSSMTAEQIQQLVRSAVAETLQQTIPLVLESAERDRERMAAELARERQETERLRQEIADLRAAPPRRRMFRR